MESSDYTFTSTDVTFSSGSNDSTLGCVSIDIESDTALEGNQTFTVTLTTSDPDVLAENDMTVITIEDNDGVSIYIKQRIAELTSNSFHRCDCISANYH